ncbi:hypothetical protein KPH14_004105 [Odynerus spinipes]|uniref:Uncharacterized protein n=1 Tax=Odynerus spinipes TaxID=1348599 RepID=A0AAD9VV71_9HYME|nr:hypothetical protein KPH14_004105 [Odynerus spinipes]
MKHQQITVDVSNMVFTACSYLALAGAVWIFLRLLQACFWLPRHLKKQNDVQQMLQDKVDSYEKYILECEEKEKTMILEGESTEEQNAETTKKWKERRECLEMLKRELKKVRDGGEINDWDYLLEEDEEEEEENEKSEKNEKKNEKDGAKNSEIHEEDSNEEVFGESSDKFGDSSDKFGDSSNKLGESSEKLDGSPKKAESTLTFVRKGDRWMEQEEEKKKDK